MGYLKLSLVSAPVKAGTAKSREGSEVKVNQLHSGWAIPMRSMHLENGQISSVLTIHYTIRRLVKIASHSEILAR
jgi:hypothetical protein